MPRLLQDYARRQAEERPSASAVVFEGERLTYGELESRSNRLARLIKDAHCEPGDRICLLTSKSPAAVVAMHAVLKADCAYVPVDVATPAARVARVLIAAEPKLLLVDASARTLLEGLFTDAGLSDSIPLGSLEQTHLEGERFQTSFAEPDADTFSESPFPSGRKPEDIAHILFTSGSTGMPKGVPITHSNVSHFVEWATRYFGISNTDRNSGHPPLHFDLSTFDIYGTFLAGAELHLVPAELNLQPDKIATFIRDAGLTQWFSVPSTLTLMAKFDALREKEFPALRRLLWCGEVLPTPTLIYWMQHLRDVTFTNLYGPTEATIASSYHTVPNCPASDTEQIPIGVACEGEELLVLDHELRATENIGDIYIAGVGLSPGYWRDEKQTAKVFVRNPFAVGPDARIYRTGDLGRFGDDGLVYFAGRADSQIKSRGYRIELGEIEAALNALTELRESAAVGVPTEGFEGIAICCAYVPRPGSSISPAHLRQRLSAQLPSYMLPARWLELEELPKNVNGKIDRKLIRERFASESAPQAERPAANAT